MTILVALVLTVLTFTFIVYPFFKKGARVIDLAENEQWRELCSRRDTTYSMLKELEFDFQSGVLTKEDYSELEEKYSRKAISVLRDIDNWETDSNVEEEIEKQVQNLRQGTSRLCPQCGAGYKKGDRFCSHCGALLSRGGKDD